MLYELLIQSASSFSERPALVEGDRALNYLELLEVVEATKQHLRDGGLGPGETVVIQVPNSIECVAGLFALGGLGATILLLDSSLKAEEVDRYSKQAGATAILCRSPGAAEQEEGGLSRYAVPSIDSLRAEARKVRRPSQIDRPLYQGGQNLFLLLSSGTMGPPKIVARTAAQTEAALRIFRATLPYSEADRVLAVLPFFHSFGLLNVLLSTLGGGAALHMESFSPRRTATTIERERITVLPATPFMFRILAETDFRLVPDCFSLRLAVSAGSALSSAVAGRFREKFGIAITQSYGTTETGPVALAQPHEQVDEAGWVGTPYVGVTVEIRGPGGNPVRTGSQGEIRVKSAANCSGYLHNPAANAATFQEGFVLTGDLGHRNEAGHLFILGRRKPMLDIAGKKVSPTEVEACLRNHPAVADVLVAGARTPDGNERVKALVVPAGEVTALELQEFCGRTLADFKVPREITFVENLSHGPMGKAPGSDSDRTGGDIP